MSPTASRTYTIWNDLYDLARNIKFRKTYSEFQNQLNEDVRNINNSEEIYVPADKATSIYKVKLNDYNRLLNENVTAKYEKTEEETVSAINNQVKIIASKLNIQNKVECYSRSQASVTLKHHKPNFVNYSKCRLLNPAKTKSDK